MQSTQMKHEMVWKKGVWIPFKSPCLPLSSLTSLLSSARVQVGHRELNDIYMRFADGRVTAEDTFNSRRICALNLLIGLDPKCTQPQTEMYKNELADLRSSSEEKVISLEELMGIVFPSDGEERQEILDGIRLTKNDDLQDLLAESKKKWKYRTSLNNDGGKW